jgi:hypothetical protein
MGLHKMLVISWLLVLYMENACITRRKPPVFYLLRIKESIFVTLIGNSSDFEELKNIFEQSLIIEKTMVTIYNTEIRMDIHVYTNVSVWDI